MPVRVTDCLSFAEQTFHVQLPSESQGCAEAALKHPSLQTLASWRPPASLRGTLRVSKRMELREALRAGLCVSF